MQLIGSLVVCDMNSPSKFVTIFCGDFPNVLSVFVVSVNTKANRLTCGLFDSMMQGKLE